MRALLIALLLCAAVLPAAAQDTVFLAFGDSVTVGHGDGSIRCPNNTAVGGYPPRLEKRLRDKGLDADFANHGVCGERTDAGVTRIDGVLEKSGDVVAVMEGTNDISVGIGLETTLFNLGEMGRKVSGAGKVPLLASVVPRGPNSGRDSNNGKTYNLALRLEEDAAEAGWPFADPFHALFGLQGFYERYYNDQLHPNASGYDLVAAAFEEAALEAAAAAERCHPSGPCVASDTALCLIDGRFTVRVDWRDFAGAEGLGNAVPQTANTGAFWFFNPTNVELVVKVLDGRRLNQHFWVFYASLSSVEFTLTVSDSETGGCRAYHNPSGTFASVGDTRAFFVPAEEPSP